MTNTDVLQRTPLHELHVELGAKMVPFAGYDMPVQYPLGIKGEHLHTREKAGLFDVSHMGQVVITGDDAESMIEALVPGDIRILKEGRMRYSVLTLDNGGILDDLMITRRKHGFFLVINASRKTEDLAHLQANIKPGCDIRVLEDRALIALQGPKAVDVLAQWVPECKDMAFMSMIETTFNGTNVFVSRCGYTGEDGFEISIPAYNAAELTRTILAHDDVEAIGLGARDTLRLEAGLCLYGHDLNDEITPVEADLSWVINKRRKEEGGFKGSGIILNQLRDGVAQRRVGIQPEGRVLAREGTEITNADGRAIGTVTSGGFGPSVDGPVAMGYVLSDYAEIGTTVDLMVRGKARKATIVEMPFAPHRYYRKPKN